MNSSDHIHHQATEAQLKSNLSFFEKVQDSFSQYGFMPHGHCYLWKPLLVSIHVISDALIGLAYISISITLYGLVKRIKLPFNGVVLCFGVFIGACGLTHFMEIWNLWNADYWWSAWVKAITAIASVGTGIYLFKLRHTIVNVAEAAKLAEQRRLDLESLNKENALELSRVRDEFTTMANNISQLAWMADETGHIFWYNKRWYDYTGTTFEEMQGWGWEKVHDPIELQRMLITWKHSLASGEIWEDNFPLRSKDGDYRWFLTRAMPIRDDNGKILRWFGTNTDIHEQTMHEANLKALAERLDQAVAARDEFLSIASHELKTPLTSLTIQAQQHLRFISKNDPRAYEKERIDRNAEQTNRLTARLNRLVDDMLDISRIRTGKLSMNQESSDLAPLIKSVVDKLEGQFAEANVTKPVINLNQKVIGFFDPFRIEQVVTNLIQNALRYGSGKPIEIILMDKGSMIQFIVKDYGIGIAPDSHERIFNRFERAVSANDVSGFGLGLFISKQIVIGHGGRIWVESELNQGSSFIVELPKSGAK